MPDPQPLPPGHQPGLGAPQQPIRVPTINLNEVASGAVSTSQQAHILRVSDALAKHPDTERGNRALRKAIEDSVAIHRQQVMEAQGYMTNAALRILQQAV